MAKKKRAAKKPKKSAPKAQAHFTPELFSFLRALAKHNDRAWFTESKERYETHVKQPLLDFISDFAPRLAGISKQLIADPRPVGGSMFRVYRDTRFSKDKTPYKTHASAHFQHRASKGASREESVHAPGFYLHLEPGSVFIAGGLWRPPTDVAVKIRRGIDAHRAEWKRAVGRLELDGDSLKRPPTGFDPEHPLIEDLKRKDFIASVTLSEKTACSPDFLDDVTDACKKMSPLMSFLTRASGFSY